MSFNLLDAAKGLITNELVSKAGSYLGESESGVAKAISGILPSVISGITEKASTHEGANTIANLASQAHDNGLINNLGSFFTDNNSSLLSKGAGLLSGLFGDNRTNVLTNLISGFSGIKSSSASSLLSMAAPLVLGLLGKHAAGSNLSGGGIASLLSGQKNSIVNALPAGLSLGSIFSGLSGKTTHVASASDRPRVGASSTSRSGGSSKWLLPLLLLGLLGLIAWFLLEKGCSGNSGVAAGVDSLASKTEQVAGDIKDNVATAAGKLDSLTQDWIYDGGNDVTIDLPNGAGKLTVGENSTENKLYKFLMDDDQKLDTAKGNWFEFTNVHFKTGGAELDSASMAQLTNMVAIAKAFPKAEFKLGGYTDNTGDSVANIALSQKRAEAVVAQLKKLGTTSNSISGAKGYGPQWPIADNATPEGRAQNRRVAVNVKAK